MYPILIGPAASWDELNALDTHNPFAEYDHETRIYYDGPQVAILTPRSPANPVYLQTTVGRTTRKDEDVYTTTERVHYLAFPNYAALAATLHDEDVPTIASYQQATWIIAEERSWKCRSEIAYDCKKQLREVALDDIYPDDLPHDFLQPGGNNYLFSANDLESLSKKADRLYEWPLPQHDVVAEFDGPRAWIGPNSSLHTNERAYHWTIVLEDNHEVAYRLVFQDEDALRATLGRYGAPTAATFAQAKSIHRETLTLTADAYSLKIETLPLDKVPTTELPLDSLKPIASQQEVKEAKFGRKDLLALGLFIVALACARLIDMPSF